MHKSNTEYLSKDIFDEGFLDVYKYIHALEMLIGMCRVDARARFVTAPSRLQKVYTCVSTMLIRSTVSMIALLQYLQLFADYPKLYSLVVSIVTLQALATLANTVHVRFLNNGANVRLFFEMQDVDRVMNITNNNTIYGIIRTVNNISVIFILGFAVVMISSAAIVDHEVLLVGSVGLVLSYGPFIVEIVHIHNMVVYFYVRISFINAIISNSIKTSKKHGKWNYLIISRHFMRNLAAHTHAFPSSETDVYLKNLLSCFGSFQKLYNFQVFLFSLHNILLVVLLFEFGIECLKYKVSTMETEWAIIGVLVFIGSIQALFLSFRCEQFYDEIKETKRLSISILSRHLEGPLRTKAKEMLKIIEETRYHFTVYDLQIVDFRLFIISFDLITYFFITLIQFAFP